MLHTPYQNGYIYQLRALNFEVKAKKKVKQHENTSFERYLCRKLIAYCIVIIRHKNHLNLCAEWKHHRSITKPPHMVDTMRRTNNSYEWVSIPTATLSRPNNELESNSSNTEYWWKWLRDCVDRYSWAMSPEPWALIWTVFIEHHSMCIHSIHNLFKSHFPADFELLLKIMNSIYGYAHISAKCDLRYEKSDFMNASTNFLFAHFQ